jgi:dienelactone hydrolase
MFSNKILSQLLTPPKDFSRRCLRLWGALVFFCILYSCAIPFTAAQYPATEKVVTDFRKLLERPMSDLRPSFETFTTDSVIIDKGFFYSEENERVPVLIYKPVSDVIKTFPVVICLHGTGGSKDEESMRRILYRFSKAGFMAVAIDARFHGERISGGAHGSREYIEAITEAWKTKDSILQKHPLYYDTVFDLWRLTDYLLTRPDVQGDRIGMMGISMGGIETWLAASTDKRVKVAVPIISAQSFKWSIENNQWQGRARTIWPVHEQVAKDNGDSAVNRHNVRLLWNKLLPGITTEFDCPSMIRLFAPRPLLVLNNEKDPNCPLPGAELAYREARKAYASKKATSRLQTDVTPGEPHRLTERHISLTVDWFKKWL